MAKKAVYEGVTVLEIGDEVDLVPAPGQGAVANRCCRRRRHILGAVLCILVTIFLTHQADMFLFRRHRHHHHHHHEWDGGMPGMNPMPPMGVDPPMPAMIPPQLPVVPGMPPVMPPTPPMMPGGPAMPPPMPLAPRPMFPAPMMPPQMPGGPAMPPAIPPVPGQMFPAPGMPANWPPATQELSERKTGFPNAVYAFVHWQHQGRHHFGRHHEENGEKELRPMPWARGVNPALVDPMPMPIPGQAQARPPQGPAAPEMMVDPVPGMSPAAPPMPMPMPMPMPAGTPVAQEPPGEQQEDARGRHHDRDHHQRDHHRRDRDGDRTEP